jgi:hypothetical protein
MLFQSGPTKNLSYEICPMEMRSHQETTIMQQGIVRDTASCAVVAGIFVMTSDGATSPQQKRTLPGHSSIWF